MTGIRVTGIAEEVSEKQLKAYFSNPNNGGGPVREIYYPLQDNDAVILFESPSVMLEIFKNQHHLADSEVKITPLPRQIYDKGIMEIEKGVSVILSLHRAVIDELQYIGNLKVDFDYNQECYMLKGSWYQLEWALHLLNRSMDSIEGIQKPASEKTEQSKPQPDTGTSDNARSKSPVRSPSPKIRSQSPVLLSHKPIATEADSHAGATGYTPETYKFFFDEEGERFPKNPSYDREKAAPVRGSGKKNKNKNVQGNAAPNKITGGSSATHVRSSDKKEPKSLSTLFNKPRPKRPVGPSLTSGLDVSLTDFGEQHLSLLFDVNNILKVNVVKANIVKQRTDGIVCPNTPDLSNAYGIARAIAQASDKRFFTECVRHVRDHGLLELAQVVHTNAGGNLNHHVGFILHVVGPQWDEKDCEASMHFLVCAYLNCFQYSETTLWLGSLSTPLISAGQFGFPLDVCVQAFYDALLIHAKFVDKSPHLQEIQLVCFDSDSTGATIMILQSLLDLDKKQSESAALERYHNGCSKYRFNAKMLMTDEDNRKDALKKDVVEEKGDEDIASSSDEETAKEEQHERDEKIPLLTKEVEVEKDTSTVVSESVVIPAKPFTVNAKTLNNTLDRNSEVTGNTITFSNEAEASKKADIFSKKSETQMKENVFDDRETDSIFSKKAMLTEESAHDKDIQTTYNEDRELNVAEIEVADADETHGNTETVCVERKLSDDETEESHFSTKHMENEWSEESNNELKILEGNVLTVDVIEDEVKEQDCTEHKMKELLNNKEATMTEFQEKIDSKDGDKRERTQMQTFTHKSHDESKKEPEKPKQETDTQTEETDKQTKSNDSIEFDIEPEEIEIVNEFNLMDDDESAEDLDLKQVDVSAEEVAVADDGEPDRTTVEREDFSQSQWSIVLDLKEIQTNSGPAYSRQPHEPQHETVFVIWQTKIQSNRTRTELLNRDIDFVMQCFSTGK